ncbi:N-acetylglucosamine-6-phosphate deacetylase [Zunongwangia endophytica]|uniref:N-acetylglucosamine-6-phosphate deacetylase n=1 Tax=Zunongwangia endophytica TaxID=1808945 RepID=A0ABV8HEX5_9FLAO|nr:amidohydrolase family protein [Zunongwangia endophytica]MDN3593443.1 amidohydrolase family protein [Zunongwangia endophytica]
MGIRLQGIHYKTHEIIEVEINSGYISRISPLQELQEELIIAPGLVDLQINGFKGIDFNEVNLTQQQVLTVTQELFKTGITGYFPTLITNSDAAISKTIEVLVKSCEAFPLVRNSIMGIHLEGPFLSAEEGSRGAHPLKYIKAPDWDLFCKWQEQSKGMIKLITLAPELPGADSFIKKCVASGVKVALGHTAANARQIQDAVSAGATCSTHLGNASHQFLPRHDNYIWEQLATEQLWATLIADGFHLPQAILSVFLKVKKGKSVLVSDATRFAGLPPGVYKSHIGGAVELDEAGKLCIQGNPRMLAGSAKSLLDCVNHLLELNRVKPADVFEMASLKPLELLGGGEHYELMPGSHADLIVFELKNSKTRLHKTLKGGELVYTI